MTGFVLVITGFLLVIIGFRQVFFLPSLYELSTQSLLVLCLFGKCLRCADNLLLGVVVICRPQIN